MQIPLRTEAQRADAGEWLSRQSVDHALLRRLVIGKYITPLAYEVSDTPADEVPDFAWLHFEGDPQSTSLPWPRLYKKAGIIGVNGSGMDDLAESLRDEGVTVDPAVAFRFGELIMTARIGQRFHPNQFGMGLGKKSNDVTAGFVGRANRQFYAPRTTNVVEHMGINSIARLATKIKIKVY